MADPARHAEERPALERLLRKIPGFKGYLEREDRRESDQLARALVVEQLRRCKTGLDRYLQAQVDAGRLEALPAGERLRSRLDRVQSRVQGALRGYSGFLDYVRVDAGLLEQVYLHDLALVDRAEELAQAFASLEAPGDPTARLAAVDQQLTNLDGELDARTRLLEGMN